MGSLPVDGKEAEETLKGIWATQEARKMVTRKPRRQRNMGYTRSKKNGGKEAEETLKGIWATSKCNPSLHLHFILMPKIE
jgi:hypothetical protein